MKPEEMSTTLDITPHENQSIPMMMVGPPLASAGAGCKSCYTRPPHLRSKCCGNGKAKLYKKKSSILSTAVVTNILVVEDQLEAMSYRNTNTIHFSDGDHSTTISDHQSTSWSVTLRERLTPTKGQSCTENQHSSTTLEKEENEKTSQPILTCPPLVDVTTHQEGIEKPSRMRSVLSGLLQRKTSVMVSLGLSSPTDTTQTGEQQTRNHE